MDGQESSQSLKGTPLLGQVFMIQLGEAERMYKMRHKVMVVNGGILI